MNYCGASHFNDDAKVSLTIATLNLTLAELKLAAAATKPAANAAASTAVFENLINSLAASIGQNTSKSDTSSK